MNDAELMAHEAKSMATESLMTSQTAIQALKDHTDVCFEATKNNTAALISGRVQSNKNHDIVMKTLHKRCSEISRELATFKVISGEKETKFYRGLAIGSVAIVTALVAVVWAQHLAGVA